MEQPANWKNGAGGATGEGQEASQTGLFVGLDMGGTLSKIAVMIRGSFPVDEADFNWRDPDLECSSLLKARHHARVPLLPQNDEERALRPVDNNPEEPQEVQTQVGLECHRRRCFQIQTETRSEL